MPNRTDPFEPIGPSRWIIDEQNTLNREINANNIRIADDFMPEELPGDTWIDVQADLNTFRRMYEMRIGNKMKEKNMKKTIESITKIKHMPNIMNPVKQCHNCGKFRFSNDFYSITDQKYTEYCITCCKSSFSYCKKCNVYHRGNHSCEDLKSTKPSKFEYNYIPVYKEYKLNPNDNILFGIELEVELNNNNISKTNKIYKLPYIYYKRDGSLSDRGEGGLEIVTMPIGWNLMKQNLNMFDSIFDLAKLGITSRINTTCGMHVHISKNIWGTYQIYKLIEFFNRNLNLIYEVSGRSLQNMLRWASFEGMEAEGSKRLALNKTNRDKHIAVNLKNPDSIEIRIFNGTLSKSIFFKNIEFVKALYDFTLINNLTNMTEQKFIEYVKLNKKEFPNLHWYLFSDLKELLIKGE